jgi:iron(II)-dependent oxidoreductase
MDIYEVNNRQYQACVDSKLCQPPHAVSSSTRPNYYGSADFDYYPVVNIDRAMADLFCSQWRGGRLPSEDEWEFAARGPVGQAFPWGDQPATCVLANLSAGSGCAQDTQPVTAFPAGSSVYGIANMIGNVWEWVGGSGGDGLLKGGAWDSQADAINASTRLEKPPASFADDAGFRCARGS